jgi:hypothetical protein
MFVLKTYSRIFTSDLGATLEVLRVLVGREPEIREPFQDMEVLTIGGFCVVARPAESMRPFIGAVGPVVVDDIAATKAAVEGCGVEIISPITDVMTGRNMFSRTRDGVVIEYVQWPASVWEPVLAASSLGHLAVTTVPR